MINRFFNKFRLFHEKEDPDLIVGNIDKGVVFRGTNLWVLIFAIFIASLGLNLNSTAVIIGAMLISPLMGPIMGIGLSVGINDLLLLRKSLYNYLVAMLAALATSTLFFFISPLNEAHSEILSRTSPTIYDVLIAFFGGLAGIVATGSKQKGNVIPGVAIATALMPPLCTAGYGLATFQLSYFIGAFYLFIINTVFIALATYITVRLFKLPYKHLPDKKADARSQRVIWAIVLVTLIPSLYFGYDIVQQQKFVKKANLFIDTEAKFPNDYLLNRKIDARKKSIVLTFGGAEIPGEQVAVLKKKLDSFGLENTSLDIHQGFAWLAEADPKETRQSAQLEQLNVVLKLKEDQLRTLQYRLDSMENARKTAVQVYNEIKAQYPDLVAAAIGPSDIISGEKELQPSLTLVCNFAKNKSRKEKIRLENWLKVRLKQNNLQIIFK